MVTGIEIFLRFIRRFFSRSEWAIRLLRLPKLEKPTTDPGLVMVQIDGLSLTQLNRALQKGRTPFLKSLLQKERYILYPFYSGLPSNTPAVQGELFYGVKCCVPAFSFVDRKLGETIKMFDASYVEQFEPRLKEQAQGLLSGGSAYSNIFTGGAKEAHFCWAQLGLGGILHAANPLVFPFLVILYIDIFLRTFFLLVIEFFLAVYGCIRGTLKGQVFFKELEMIWLRTLVCVLLRELIVTGVCMDIMRGLPVIHLNFLGYDEQAHCRGPSSRFAHWSLQGIDDAIHRIHHVMGQSPYRDYDIWVYGDHGQEKTTPYLVEHGRTLEEAVEKLFGSTTKVQTSLKSHSQSRAASRARLLKAGKIKSGPLGAASPEVPKPDVVVAAMGPLGHIYVSKKLTKKEFDIYAGKLVTELKIPLVLTREESQKVTAWTPHGTFSFPDQAAQVFGDDHPFLEEIKEDLLRVCFHPDAGEFIIAGWSKGEPAISFPVEYGAHASMGAEETRSFALLPMDTPLNPKHKPYLRATDLREAAQWFLNKEPLSTFFVLHEEVRSKRLRLMSYNVHGCLGMDGVISAERIARVIARHHPDIVALQELDVGRTRSGKVDQAERIARKLEMNHHFHSTFSWQDEQYGNAILSRYPMGLIKMEALPQLAKKSQYEPRGAIWVTIEFQGTKIQIINTHLSIWPQERLIQVNTLLGAGWLKHPDCAGPVIVCGDFNAVPGSPVYRKISEQLKDSQTILADHRPHRTWYGRYPLSRIDYIFVTPDFTVKSISVPRMRLDKVASDHLPLIADLSLIKPVVR